jgi:RHS repeat-associated protein
MNKKITLLIFAMFAFAHIKAQLVEVVESKDITDANVNGKSYQYTNYIRLLPTFSFAATAESTFFCKPYDIQNQPPTVNKNFVRTETILVPNIQNENSISTLTVQGKSTEYSYIDGLGRPTQTVSVQASPGQLDIVKFQKYDGFGRQLQEFLPYAITSSKGAYRTDAEFEVGNFYKTSPQVSWDNEPFKVNQFDNSPLNQVRKAYGAGKVWHTNGKGAESKLLVNTAADAVRFFTYTGVSSVPPYYNLPTLSGTYPANTLTIEETKDEEGQIKRVFKNFKGQIVLSRVGDATKWFDTNYVYDWEGNVFCVFPPEASVKLATASNYESATDAVKYTFLMDNAFVYEYDNYQRAVAKKIPGAAWKWTVYDKWDRVTMSYDGQLVGGNQQWQFTKYDEFNRPIITGLFYLSSSTTQASAQALVDSFYSGNFRFEVRQNDATGYTQNRTYPFNADESNLLTVTYYDDYNFLNYSGWDAEGKSYSYVQENNLPPSSALLTSYRGYTTGSKVRVVGDTRWLNSVTYYDNKYRVVQTITENHLNGTDRLSTEIDFAGRSKKVLRTHTTSAASFTLLEQYEYDHAGRVLKTWQTLDGAPQPTLVSAQKYNEAGEVVEKNIHSTDNGATFLQSVDYRYNIRGWLTSINNSSLTNDANVNPDNASSSPDIMGMELLYNTSESINGANTRQLWNGNIGAIKWKTTNFVDPATEKIYGYNYDRLNRLTNATYATKGASAFTDNVGAYNNNYEYDNNGNIRTQVRYGLAGGAVKLIDNLGYKYVNDNSATNKLRNVNDDAVGYTQFGAKGYGFVEKTYLMGDEYVYDARGNAIQDLNKGIDVAYNHLSMPTRVDFGGNTYIQYTYDALGNKLSGKTFQNGTLIANRDYVAGVQYEGNSLAFINSGDGRIIKRGTQWQNEYFLRDHQGNTLAAFGNLTDANVYKASIETGNASKATYEQNTFINISNSRRSQDYNNTPITADLPTPNKSILTNGIPSTIAMGPGIRFRVNPGDRIKMSVQARTIAPTSGGNFDVIAGSLVSIVTTGYNLTPGEAAYNGFNNKLDGELATLSTNSGSPRAYFNYILFNSTYDADQFGYKSIGGGVSAGNGFEKLELEMVVPAGYTNGDMFIYTTNESNYNVYFDEVYIVHEKTNSTLQVTQLSDYYPFGLAFNTWNKESIKANRYLYQKQEAQDDLGYDEYQYKYRMHDPAMGRFLSVDPLSEKYMYNSTYAFSENRVIDGIELEGKEYMPLPTNLDMRAYTEANSQTVEGAWETLTDIPKGLWNTATNLPGAFNNWVNGLYNLVTNPIGVKDAVVGSFKENPNRFIGQVGMGAVLAFAAPQLTKFAPSLEAAPAMSKFAVTPTVGRLSNAELVSQAAIRAELNIGGTGRFAGFSKHTYATRFIELYQARYGQRGLKVNEYFKDVGYGKGFLDVRDMTNGIIYDFKFGDPFMSNRQFNKYSKTWGLPISIVDRYGNFTPRF